MTKVHITVSIDDDLAVKIREQSKQTGIPVSVAVERYLMIWLKTGVLPPIELPESEPKEQ